MNIQKIARILCLLLAVLILFNTVVRPLEVQATAIATTATVVGISPLAAVVGILACLGIAYFQSSGFQELCSTLVNKIPSKYKIDVDGQSMVEAISMDGTVYVSEELIRYVSSNVTYDLEESPSFPFVNLARPFCYVLSKHRFHAYYQSYYSNYSLATFVYFSNGRAELILTNSPPTYTNLATEWCEYTFELPCIRYQLAYDYDSYPNYVGSVTGGNQMSMSGATSQTVELEHVNIEKFHTIAFTDAIFSPYIEAAPDLDDDEEYQAWKARRAFRVIEGGNGDEDPDDDDDDDDGLRVLAPYYPVPGAENVENLPESQEQAWAGNRQEDPEDDPVSDPIEDVDVVTDPDSYPDDAPNSGDASGGTSDTGTTSTDLSGVLGWLQRIWAAITDLPSNITTSITDALTDFWTDVKTAVLSIPDVLADIWEWIQTIPQVLVDALATVFIPADGYLDAKVDTLLAKYTFLNGFKSDMGFLMNQIGHLGTTPPVIYIPLSSSETSYSLGSDTIFLDLSWYEKYKPTVDSILSAFLWILFIFKLFLKLPGIVSGLPGDFVMGGLNDFGLADHLPSRKAAYEVQRQSNREYIRKGGK